jgi:hypothetical protein
MVIIPYGRNRPRTLLGLAVRKLFEGGLCSIAPHFMVKQSEDMITPGLTVRP